ncbi:MAG: hypothetical protein V4649_17385 [Bacteroidota bacterium]
MKYIVFTPMMEEDEFLAECRLIVDVLLTHEVNEVEMFFGTSWGDWQPFSTVAAKIWDNIRMQETTSGSSFPGHDVYITVLDRNIEFVFCHECDVHIEFDEADDIVRETVSRWRKHDMVHCVKRDKVEVTVDDLSF